MGQTQQLYGRNDMVMLDQQDKIYGSLGMHESYLLNSVKGNPMVMANSREGTFGKEVTDLKLYGWSKQESTTGVQLFNTDALKTQTIRGITLTNNMDGTLTVTGAAENSAVYITLATIQAKKRREIHI